MEIGVRMSHYCNVSLRQLRSLLRISNLDA